ncbi:hypothetical protein AVEN_72368-1 [Araneus ventricosus]|uniref:Uncharacterized protein n=1 Tax=Araneus ventricosus TaxID=182803 RepID=A0A4Y2S2R7_ARAVE|nr:hypothetical protein AVEN_72368-1 [Araneus ventricosus]
MVCLPRSVRIEKNPMHRQCPAGRDSWCTYKRALCDGKEYLEQSPGLPNSVIKAIKPTYLIVLPKETFVQQKSLFLGAHSAEILFNSRFLGLLLIFNYLEISTDPLTPKNYMGIDIERVLKSKDYYNAPLSSAFKSAHEFFTLAPKMCPEKCVTPHSGSVAGRNNILAYSKKSACKKC